jgi:putative ABC transport system permease protein
MFRLILRNLWEKKTRTLLTISGLAIATGTLAVLLAFQRGYERGLQTELAQLGAHILVVPKGCPYDAASLALHGASWPCYLKEAYLSQVEQTPGVAVAAPVFMAADDGRQREVVVGITRQYLDLRPSWRINGRFPQQGEVLLGAESARRLGTAAGSTTQIGLLKRTVRVSGVLAPVAGPEDAFMFMPLVEVQQGMRHAGQLTHVLVKLRSPDLLEQTVRGLRGCDAGMQMNIVPLTHLFETIRNVSAAAKYLLAAMSTIAFLIAGTALANTMFMAVLERTREIGVLRALGASRSQIFGLFAGETLVAALGASILGILISFSGARFIEQWVRSQIAYAPKTALIALDPVAIAISVGFALLLALLAGMVPAIRAARLHPVEAFRAHARY